MVDGGASIEQLIASAREGDDGALRELFDRCEPLLAQVASDCGAAEGAPSTQIVSQTLQAARDRFGQFDGSTQHHLLGWLRGLLHQQSSTSAPQRPHFAHGHDATLQKTTDARTEVLHDDPAEFAAAETLSVLAGQAPSPLEETLQGEPKLRANDSGDGQRDRLPAAPRSASTPTRFGKYELISMIAKGGMGVVYKAHDAKLNRTVALKMILSGSFAGEGEIARFYAEAKAAAKLRHPNIVAIFDYGDVDDQPFFAMDYIEGGGLSDLVRENALPPEKAASLVKTVAEAMHYAHEKGILHRDLKPSNVLLDNAGQPMITDFGLAKQVEGHSGLTVSGTVLGTPSYMPPEQAAGHIDDVQVPSDVYSIGAILYELLTGRPPFRAANAVETLKRVLDTEPVSPRLLNPGIPVDIETICLKCLQKEPAARYASAQELADELERFLAGEPILARPIGRVARLWRWCRRKPKVALLAGTALLGTMIAVGSITVGYVMTSSALTQAEQSLAQTLVAINDLYILVSTDELLNTDGLQPTRKKLLAKAGKLLEQILEQQGDHPDVRQDLALAYYHLGHIMQDLEAPQEALAPLRRARSMQEALLAQSATEEGESTLGDILSLMGEVLEKVSRFDDALAMCDNAIQIRKSLAKKAPKNPEYGRKLANAYMNSGLVERAIAERLKSPAIKERRFQNALARCRTAQDERLALLAGRPDDAELRLDLARGYYNIGNIGFLMERDDVALENLQHGIDQFDLLLAAEPENLDYNFLRALCNVRYGDVIVVSEQPHGAKEHYKDAIHRLRMLAGRNDAVHKYKGALAQALVNLGILQAEFRDPGAVESYREAKSLLEPLVVSYPEMLQYQHDLETTLTAIAALDAR
jgi:tRNA A-37 threonylcarbamoyl transferase component Bud32/tetratricopeptide (TPR) repeat protein